MTQLTLPKPSLRLPLTVAATHGALELMHNIMPVVYPLLIAERGYTYAQIGTLALVTGLCGTIGQPFFGWLSDRWDARWLALISIVWMSAGMALVGLGMPYGALLVVVGAAAMASAAYHPAGASLANAIKGSRAGAVMSYFSLGGSAGSAASPILIALLLGAFGLTGTLWLLPLGVLLAVALYLPLRDITITDETRTAPKQRGALLPIVLLIVVTGSRSWLYGAFGNYLPEWFSSQGVSLQRASLIYSIYLISVSSGSFGGGFLVDRFGGSRVLAVAIGALAPLYWLFLNAPTAVAFVALLLLGFAIGTTFPTVILMAQRVWPRAVGLASALVIGIGWLPASFGAWTVGRVADAQSLSAALNAQTFVPLVGVVALAGYVLTQRRSTVA